MEFDNRPIGVFDSGVGGLTVAYEMLKIFPNEKIIYFGDSLRAPYGNSTKKKLLKISCEIIDFFIEKDVKAIVVACNTLCATVLEDIKEIYKDYNIIFQGVIEASVDEALLTGSKNIGVFGTKNTIKFATHKNLIQAADNTIKVTNTEAPIFAPLIEHGLHSTRVAYEAAKFYSVDMIENGVDTIILGCTHYPIMSKTIREVFEKHYPVTLINPSKRTAEYLYEKLSNENLLGNRIGRIKFLTSGFEENFKFILNILFEVSYDIEILEIGD